MALYNHRGWFGNPYNQLEILKQLKDESIPMVYNFNHAHEYVDQFPEIAKKIKPYVSYVNLNGVKKEDVQKVLNANINGLKTFNSKLKKEAVE